MAIKLSDYICSNTTANVVQSTSDPTSSNDGHKLGTIWINTSTDDYFICTENASGAAVWSSGGADAVQSTNNPTSSDDSYDVGTIWVNTSTDKYYICTDNSSNSAVWESGGSTNEEIQDVVGDMVTGNTETNITVTYDDPNGKLDFAVNTADNSTLGVASFNSTYFTVNSGTVSIANDSIGFNQLAHNINATSIGFNADKIDGTDVNDSGTTTSDLWTASKTKSYIDSLVSGLDWQDSVLDKDLSTPPASPSNGDRYIVGSSATGDWSGHDNEIAEYNGSSWDFINVSEGLAAWVEDEDVQYVYNSSSWVKMGTTVTHNNTSGLQGGTTNEYYHLTNTEYTNFNTLTDNSIANSLHRHSELVAGDGDPDPAFWINAYGEAFIHHGYIYCQYQTGYTDNYKRRITVNDGGGNWNFRTGTKYDGGNLVYTKTGDGAANISLNSDGVNGFIDFYIADSGTVGNTISWSNTLRLNNSGIGFTQRGTYINEFSTDGTLAGNSDTALPTEKAVKTYTDNEISTHTHSKLVASDGSPDPALSVDDSGNVKLYGRYFDLGYGLSTEGCGLQIGNGRTGNGYTYIDLIGDATYTDYGLRVARNNGGANTISEIQHRGTGGLYLNAHDAGFISLSTNNTDRVRINSSGNVGIGTTSPSYKLDIKHDTNVWDGLRIYETGISGEGFRILHYGGTGSGTKFDQEGNLPLRFVTNKIERMRVNGDGSLYTYGSIHNFGTGLSTETITLQLGSGRTGNGFTYIDLIGDTTYTDYALRISRNDDGANANSNIIHKGTGGLYLNASEAGFVSFRTQNTDRVRINSSGNVGIGTTSPSYKLDVNGSFNCDMLYTGGSEVRIKAQNGTNEGGQLKLEGAGSNSDITIDNYFSNLRIYWHDSSNHIIDFFNAGSGYASLRMNNTGASINEFSTDGTLSGNSDTALPTEKAVKTYVDDRNEIIFRPENFNYDSTDLGVDGGTAFSMFDTADFDNSDDGSIWLNTNLPLFWDTSSDIKIDLTYLLNGTDASKVVRLITKAWAVDEGDTPSTSSPDVNVTDNITSSTTNTGKLTTVTLTNGKIGNSYLNSNTKMLSIKLTREASSSSDTYSGTFQLMTVRIYQ